MNSYEEKEKRKDGAKIQLWAIFGLCKKTAQDYLRKYSGGTVGYPAQPGLICESVHQSVCESVSLYTPAD